MLPMRRGAYSNVVYKPNLAHGLHFVLVERRDDAPYEEMGL